MNPPRPSALSVDVRLDPGEPPAVSIGGYSIPGVVALHVSAKPGRVPILTLELASPEVRVSASAKVIERSLARTRLVDEKLRRLTGKRTNGDAYRDGLPFAVAGGKG